MSGTRQSSKKKGVKTAGLQQAEEDSDEDADPDGEEKSSELKKEVPSVEETFDPDIFWYGGLQGVMKLSAGECPALITAIGKEIRDLWYGFQSFVTGDYSWKETERKGNGKTPDAESGAKETGKSLTADQMTKIIVPGTERRTLVSWDVTNYLNDTNFNEHAQVLYQYDRDGKENKKKAKKTASKKAGKKSSKTAGKSSKKPTAKKNTKTTSKKSASKKKASGRKKISLTSRLKSKWNKLKSSTKSKLNKAKKGIKKAYTAVKDKASALKKSVTCKAKKVVKAGKASLNKARTKVSSAIHAGKTKAYNAYSRLKSGAKNALRYAGKSVKDFFVPESAYAADNGSATKKTGKKQTDLYQQMLLTSQYYQYVQSNGTKSLQGFKNSGSIMKDVHLMLDMTGFIIDGADPINGILYLSEKDYKNAGISFCAAVPFVGSLGTVNRISKNLKKVDEVEKAAEARKLSKNDWKPMTAKEATAAAEKLGYKKIVEKSHGQPIFKKGNKYITPDIDGHNGGAWKMADSIKNLASKNTRMGTYDENLKRIGD